MLMLLSPTFKKKGFVYVTCFSLHHKFHLAGAVPQRASVIVFAPSLSRVHSSDNTITPLQKQHCNLYSERAYTVEDGLLVS